MSALDFEAAIRQGVCTESEASTLRECISRDDAGVWVVDITGCNEAERDALTRFVHWACCEGPAQ